jgi:hypothetical protein
MKLHILAVKHSTLAFCNIDGGVGVVSESEVLEFFVTLDGAERARNVSERRNTV